jgi:hypothetical protein
MYEISCNKEEGVCHYTVYATDNKIAKHQKIQLQSVQASAMWRCVRPGGRYRSVKKTNWEKIPEYSCPSKQYHKEYSLILINEKERILTSFYYLSQKDLMNQVNHINNYLNNPDEHALKITRGAQNSTLEILFVTIFIEWLFWMFIRTKKISHKSFHIPQDTNNQLFGNSNSILHKNGIGFKPPFVSVIEFYNQLTENKSEKEKESIIIGLIWFIPIALFISFRNMIDLMPNILVIFFMLWLLLGWSFPAVYFKWKHRQDKHKYSQNNSLVERPTRCSFTKKKPFSRS